MVIERDLPDGYKVIDEKDDRYIIETEKGQTLIAYKIDTNDISKRRHEEIEKVAKKLDKKEVVQLLGMVNDLYDNPPSIVDYLGAATEVVKILRKYYDKVDSSNLFHHPIKQIDPEIYGKAQTFMHQMMLLKDTLIKIKHQIVLDSEGKI